MYKRQIFSTAFSSCESLAFIWFLSHGIPRDILVWLLFSLAYGVYTDGIFLGPNSRIQKYLNTLTLRNFQETLLEIDLPPSVVERTEHDLSSSDVYMHRPAELSDVMVDVMADVCAENVLDKSYSDQLKSNKTVEVVSYDELDRLLVVLKQCAIGDLAKLNHIYSCVQNELSMKEREIMRYISIKTQLHLVALTSPSNAFNDHMAIFIPASTAQTEECGRWVSCEDWIWEAEFDQLSISDDLSYIEYLIGIMLDWMHGDEYNDINIIDRLAKSIKSKKVFPIAGDEITDNYLGHDSRISLDEDATWLIADAPHLEQSFRGRLPLLSFDWSINSKLASTLAYTLLLQNRVLSEKCT
ncbi:hypothetical protein K505DRAFT_340766 [Melanomma pulvis-pyrius CBS 109.77]|uniref:Uncharacterized protein n=1 Tax=Melanomma pulvis-pyrius CBS 109.77 TaxID=1314802 RepID=A0A6A6X1K3_9PLEO|nr:hypothetical protein K505DRAFT_340766 [Melanomma pulvis-pyrius CBS 109.77]